MNLMDRIRASWGRLGPRDRRALILGAAVLLPVVLWIGVIRPYAGLLDETRARVEVERALLARERGLLAIAGELPGRLATATARLEEESATLLGASNAVAAEEVLMEHIQRTATRSRVLVQDARGVEVHADEAAGPLAPVRLGVRVESDLAGLASFLNRLESGPGLIRILEMSVEPARSGGRVTNGAPGPLEMGALTMSMIVEAYWMESPRGLSRVEETIETRLTGIPQ